MRMQLESLAKRDRMTQELVKAAQNRFIISEVELESDRITLSQLMAALSSLIRPKSSVLNLYAIILSSESQL